METCFEIDIQNKMVYFDSARVCREQIFQPFNCLHAQSSITFEYFLHLNVCSTFWVCAAVWYSTNIHMERITKSKWAFLDSIH